MKKLNWKFILPPPVLAALLFASCNLIQEMPKDFVETYGNIAYVESVEYTGLAENGGTPKVTETQNFKITYHIRNDGNFDLSPEFTFEGCEIKNPHVETEKKRVYLTIAGENLKTLKDGAEFKVKLTLYKATQKVLQSQYEIGMLYVYTGGPEIPKGTVKIPIPALPDGYELAIKDPVDFVVEQDEDGSWYITTTGDSGVAKGEHTLELVVKDKDGKVIDTIKKTIEVSAGSTTSDFTEKEGEKSFDKFIEEVKEKVDEIEKNPTTPETSKGTVEIKVKVPAGYTLEIDGEDKDKFEVKENEDGTCTIVAKDEGGLPEGEYDVKLVVKDENEEIPIKEVTIEVTAGKITGGFANEPDDTTFEITTEIIEENRKNVFYVRGSGEGWYTKNNHADIRGDDDKNSGTLLSPFATIQKAVDTVIEQNDGESPYTIYVDGTLTQNATDANGKKGMADISDLNENLILTIKSFPDTKATLDGGAQFDADGNVEKDGIGKSVIYAAPASGALNLTLENLVITGGNTTGSGAGIHFISNDGELKIRGDTTINGNGAKGNGGGIYVSGGMFTMQGGTITGNTTTDASGGGVYVYGSNSIMENVTISENKAPKCHGGGICITGKAIFKMNIGTTIKENTAKQKGGGVCINNGEFTMIDGKIGDKNTANTAQNGGGVYVNSGTFTMIGGTISGNIASSDGGAVYVHTGQEFTMSGGKICGENTAQNGGGVYVNGGTFTMTGGEITSNEAQSTDGGGVYVIGGTFTMSKGTISKNKSQYGSGVYVKNSGMFTMTNGEITENEASKQGGGVYVYDATLEMSDTAKITGNKAADSGGGIYVFNNDASATLTMTGGEISGNEATSNGGGVYNKGGTLIMSGGTIGRNKAESSNGGGIFNESGDFTMENGKIDGNSAQRGGGIWISGGTVAMKGGEINGNKFVAGGYGSGVVVTSSCTFNMSGNAKIAENNDVHLFMPMMNNVPKIHVNGNFNAQSHVATITPFSYPADNETRQVLSVDAGVTMDETLCNKLFSITPNNGTRWKISYDSSSRKGVLKKDNVQVSDDGIIVTIDGGETYTFVVNSNGKQIKDGNKFTSGTTMQLFEVYKNGNKLNKLTETDGTFTIEIQDESEKKWEGDNTSATGLSRDVKVPTVPVEMPAKIYVKVELNDGKTVIDATISVTIVPKS